MGDGHRETVNDIKEPPAGERPQWEGSFDAPYPSPAFKVLGNRPEWAVNELLGANLMMRRAHGVHGITDPLVQDTWLEQRRLSKAL